MTPPESSCKAFTLIELLAVIGIISLLMAVTVPSIPGMAQSTNVNRAVCDISLMLEEARAYAMGHNTYVWVGFQTNPVTQRITVGAVAGTTGQSDDLGSSAYFPITKLHVYDNFSLKNITNLSGMATNGDNITESDIGSFSQKSGNSSVTFAHVLQYSPRGMAAILSNTNSRWIHIGLQPSAKANDSNVAVFEVATLTGQVQVFRQ